MKFTTAAIHVGQRPDPETGAVIPPIYQTSTYRQELPGEHRGYDYTRAGNPNFAHLEETLAALEGGKHATVFSSGLGAILTLFMRCQAGDHIAIVDDVYGGTHRLLSRFRQQFGVTVSSVASSDPAEWERAICPKTRYVWIESPTKPLLKIFDISAICAVARRHQIVSVVDNTFASPFLQNPLALGADVVMHSTTKYIGGHSDLIGGALITDREELQREFQWGRLAFGVNPSPFDAWLASRGVKTLGLRMQQHCRSAQAIAEYLKGSGKCEAVFYPGLAEHEGHAVARQQMRSGFGGMVSARFAGKADALKHALGAMRFFTLAESLGGVESLVCHPATMTHASIPAEERLRRGISDTLVRFSVGIEETDDLLEDLQDFVRAISS